MSEPCPNCGEKIIIKRSPMQTCPGCHKNFWNDDLNIEVDMGVSGDCLENPKSHRHPDWIEQDESLSLQRYMGRNV